MDLTGRDSCEVSSLPSTIQHIRIKKISFAILFLLAQLFVASLASAQVTVTASPTSISWGNIYVGTITGSHVVTITNPLTVPVQLKSIAVTGGPNPADYPIGIICPMAHPMTAGQVCTVNVRYRPTAVGANAASLVITDSSGNKVSVALSANAIAAVTVSPATLTFPSESVGTTSSPMTITLTNAFTSKLSFSSITASGEFTVASNTCSAGVLVKAQCSILVNFTPTGSGTQTGTLTIADSAPGSPTLISLQRYRQHHQSDLRKDSARRDSVHGEPHDRQHVSGPGSNSARCRHCQQRSEFGRPGDPAWPDGSGHGGRQPAALRSRSQPSGV